MIEFARMVGIGNMEWVREFMTAFGQPIDKGFTDDKNMYLGNSLILEEAKELTQALNAFHKGDKSEGAKEHIVKELADLIYVCYWLANHIGVDIDKALFLVHKSNMSKLGEDGKPIMRNDGKVLKGPNYFEPDLSGIIANLPLTKKE